jgi:hypothetical protein
MSFAAMTLCVAYQRVFIVVSVYFVIDSVRKLLDIPSCIRACVLQTILSHDISLESVLLHFNTRKSDKLIH